MKNDPRSLKNSSPIKVSNNRSDDKTNPCLNNEYNEEKHSLDLLMSPLSPNQIERHYMNIFRMQRKAHKIRQVLLMKKRRIKILNDKFDLIVFPMLTLIEIDETFKGRDVSLLVVIDTFTGYIMHIEWLKDRSADGLITSLNPHQHLFSGVTLVLTDGAPYFPEVVFELCPLAKHQICLIHVMRGLLRLLRPSQRSYKNAHKKEKSSKSSLNNSINHLKDSRQRLKRSKQREKYWKDKRTRTRNELNVKPYEKGILKKYPILKTLNQKINEIGSYRMADVKSVDRTKMKIKFLNQTLVSLNRIKNVQWNIYMTQTHYIHDFYNLFTLPNKKYSGARESLLARLPKDTENRIINKIISLLTTITSLDTVKQPDTPIDLSRNYINTNGVESINGKIRPHLDNLRKIQNTEYIETYFSLLRLKLNLSRPNSGPRNNTSPIERYGYDLRGRTWLDVIIDGLPPGPQYAINSAKIDLEIANPQRVRKCKIRNTEGKCAK